MLSEKLQNEKIMEQQAKGLAGDAAVEPTKVEWT